MIELAPPSLGTELVPPSLGTELAPPSLGTSLESIKLWAGRPGSLFEFSTGFAYSAAAVAALLAAAAVDRWPRRTTATAKGAYELAPCSDSEWPRPREPP